ncbi:MAG: IS5 family transposase [Limnobacter sp.]|uniref:IS5 family transposase n=1 Tax=Limnobacter sp. TaxID=2003368 RepID=UPI00391DE5B1
MRHRSFSKAKYSGKKLKTQRDRFLAEIERITLWEEFIVELEPHYPKSTSLGRPPRSIYTMLRMYIAQQCFDLPDEGIEDAIHECMVIRNCGGIALSAKETPDATNLMKFRCLLEDNQLTKQVFATIANLLNMQGSISKDGAVVDGTIILAASLSKDRDKERDPEMHQTKRSNEWHFGMKAHINVDARNGAVHTLQTKSANTANITKGLGLLHGEEKLEFADTSYHGIEKPTQVNTNSNATWCAGIRPSKRKTTGKKCVDQVTCLLERMKFSIRVSLEHPFHYIKNIFGLKKIRYIGLAKNTAQPYMLFAIANLLITNKRKCALHAQGVAC